MHLKFITLVPISSNHSPTVVIAMLRVPKMVISFLPSGVEYAKA